MEKLPVSDSFTNGTDECAASGVPHPKHVALFEVAIFKGMKYEVEWLKDDGFQLNKYVI